MSAERESLSQCSCRYSDAWRCAVDQRLTDQVSCYCDCHRQKPRATPSPYDCGGNPTKDYPGE